MASETIINPDRKNTGFVYFKLPSGGKLNGMSLNFKVEKMDAKSAFDFKLRL